MWFEKWAFFIYAIDVTTDIVLNANASSYIPSFYMYLTCILFVPCNKTLALGRHELMVRYTNKLDSVGTKLLLVDRSSETTRRHRRMLLEYLS